MCSVRTLTEILTFTRFFEFTSSGGIEPDNLLPWRRRSSKSVKFPKEACIRHSRLLLCNERVSRVVNDPKQ
ncbi:hypothetical protein HanPI659440_Chr15g0580061 [Helianthus annuus]|nr:hypothetical protein HanPI659440_Chr15g0580061 [Helianthus annuus]